MFIFPIKFTLGKTVYIFKSRPSVSRYVSGNTMRHTILFLTILSLLACKNSNTNGETLVVKSKTGNMVEGFKYREILEDYVDSIQPKDISGLFGLWTITSIADVGGTLQDELKIQQQVGHKLYLDSNVLIFDFLNSTLKIEKPTYNMVYKSQEKGDNIKGSSYFWGYRMCRKQVTMVDCSKKLYFEVIHFAEMTYFYDGRIYFLTKDE